jgi:DNA-binding protein YbaB
MDVTQIPGITGWPGLVITIVTLILYGWHTNRSIKTKVEGAKKESEEKAEDIAKNAHKDAIDAMQTHLNILKERMNESERENVRMHHALELIYAALKAKGIHIAIDGDMIHIHDNGNSTTIRMKEE